MHAPVEQRERRMFWRLSRSSGSLWCCAASVNRRRSWVPCRWSPGRRAPAGASDVATRVDATQPRTLWCQHLQANDPPLHKEFGAQRPLFNSARHWPPFFERTYHASLHSHDLLGISSFMYRKLDWKTVVKMNFFSIVGYFMAVLFINQSQHWWRRSWRCQTKAKLPLNGAFVPIALRTWCPGCIDRTPDGNDMLSLCVSTTYRIYLRETKWSLHRAQTSARSAYL